jgi:glycosyltransferase involved in cell wall biosynthesis
MSEFPDSWRDLRVALSHDWLTGMRGGERVLEHFCRAFPRAAIYTLIHNPAAISQTIERHPIHASWLQNLPGIERRYRNLLPLFPLAIRTLRVPPVDLVISTSHCVAKALPVPSGVPHLCYCFTPMRYAWLFYEEYFGANPAKAALLKPMLAALRSWDRRTARRVTRFVTLSRHVQDRIRRFYGRESDLVYPPVDIERFAPHPAPRADYDLVVSALVPYKRVDLAVRAYSGLGFPLRVVGVGGERARLQALAAPNVEFLGWQSDEEVAELYRHCRLLVFPGEEDFGIVPVEAQACGRPVVAFARGGALETVSDGVSGMLFPEQTEASLLHAVDRAVRTTWNPGDIRAQAMRFGPESFARGIARCVEACLSEGRSPRKNAQTPS